MGETPPSLTHGEFSREREVKDMDRLLKLNGKSYKATEFDLNLLCDFEDAGISLEDIDKKMFNVIRQYVATSMGVDVRTAGKEITAHMANGGTLDEISDVMSAMMNESGFFRPKQKDTDSGTPKRANKKKSESEEVTS